MYSITNEQTFHTVTIIIYECNERTFQLNNLITSRNVNLNGTPNIQRVDVILIIINVIIINTLKFPLCC